MSRFRIGYIGDVISQQAAVVTAHVEHDELRRAIPATGGEPLPRTGLVGHLIEFQLIDPHAVGSPGRNIEQFGGAWIQKAHVIILHRHHRARPGRIRFRRWQQQRIDGVFDLLVYWLRLFLCGGFLGSGQIDPRQKNGGALVGCGGRAGTACQTRQGHKQAAAESSAVLKGFIHRKTPFFRGDGRTYP